MKYRTTKKHFELFKKFFNQYRGLFGLNNYTLYFSHVSIKGVYGEIITDHMGHVSRVKFNTIWDDREPTEEEIRNNALHECCHLLTNKLKWLATCRYLSEEEIEETTEEITVRLANIIKKLEKK